MIPPPFQIGMETTMKAAFLLDDAIVDDDRIKFGDIKKVSEDEVKKHLGTRV